MASDCVCVRACQFLYLYLIIVILFIQKMFCLLVFISLYATLLRFSWCVSRVRVFIFGSTIFNIKKKKSNNSYRTLWRFYRIFSHVRHSVFIFVYVFFLNEIWILCMNFVFSVCGCYVLIERSSFLCFFFGLLSLFSVYSGSDAM